MKSPDEVESVSPKSSCGRWSNSMQSLFITVAPPTVPARRSGTLDKPIHREVSTNACWFHDPRRHSLRPASLGGRSRRQANAGDVMAARGRHAVFRPIHVLTISHPHCTSKSIPHSGACHIWLSIRVAPAGHKRCSKRVSISRFFAFAQRGAKGLDRP